MRPTWLVLLVLITLAAALLRLAQADESLWLDELHTAWAAMGPADEIALRAQFGNQSPLYFYLVRGAVSCFGRNEIALRLPSLLAGIALIPLVAWLTLCWTDDRIASLTAAILVSVDHYCLFYSQEARPYAIVQLVGLVQVVCFWKLLVGHGGRWRVGLVATTVLLFHLHYTAAILLPAELVAYGLYYAVHRERLPYRPAQFALDLAVCMIGWSPALAHVWDVAGRRTNWAQMVPKPSPRLLLTLFPLPVYVLIPLAGWWLVRLCGGKGDSPLGPERPAGCCPQKGTVPFSFPSEQVGCRPWLLLICWLAVPLLATWLLTTMDAARLFMARYLIVVAVAPAVFAGVILASVASRWFRLALAALVVVAAIHHSGLVRQWSRDGRFHADRSQDWRGAVTRVRADASRKAWPLLVRGGFLEADRLQADSSELLRAYCLAPVTAMYRLDERDRPLIPLPTNAVGVLSQSALDELRGHPGIWILINGAVRSRRTIERQIITSLRRIGLNAHTELRETFGSILLIRMTVESATAPSSSKILLERQLLESVDPHG